MPSPRFQLPAGYVLTVTADANSTGTVRRVPDSGDTTTNYPTLAVVASSTRVVGSFAVAQQYEVLSTLGEVTWTLTLDEDETANESLTGTTKIDNAEGFFANFTTIPADRALTVSENTQAIVYGTQTIAGTLTIGGEIRYGAWPF
jgi:hypothetical protein